MAAEGGSLQRAPVPAGHGSLASERGPAVIVRTLQLGQHAITAVLLVVCTVAALRAGASVAPVIGSAAVFAGWYAFGPVVARRATRPHAGAWWLVGLGLIWLGMCVLAVPNVWLGFSLWLLAGHLLRSAAVPFALVVLAVVLVRPLLAGQPASVASIVGPSVGAGFALVLARGQRQLVGDSIERQRLLRSLVQAQEEMAQMQDELVRSQHEAGMLAERTRLSRDLHDTVAQGLSSVLMLVRAAPPVADTTTAEILGQIESTAADNLVDVRRIVGALTPASLADDSLIAALGRMTNRLAEETGITAELVVDDRLPPLPTPVEVALLRAAQSGLGNVRQHAAADRVAVNLAVTQDEVVLDVVDDGAGFEPLAARQIPGAAWRGGYGLPALRSRLRELGGELTVDSAPGEGTAFSARLPLTRPGDGH
ncbi:MAG: sensor histidine kinase [Microlunatus sp.]|nr:sensor histidine kinase [Microlunatus sp.]